MARLAGVGVLVTRPAQQAVALRRLLEAEGAQVHAFPALEIRAAGEPAALAAQVGDPDRYALVVFTSANAVRFGAALLAGRRDLNVAAIGPATARALAAAGLSAAITPTERVDSEGLLALPELAQVADRHVLLIKGVGGRDLLARELERRGARVTIAEVYRRAPASPNAADVEALAAWLAEPHAAVISASSEETATILESLLPPSLRAALAARLWLVPSERVAAALRERGIASRCLVAASADDTALVEALAAARGAGWPAAV